MDEITRYIGEMEEMFCNNFKYISNKNICCFFETRKLTGNTKIIRGMRAFYKERGMYRRIFDTMLSNIRDVEQKERKELIGSIRGYNRFIELLQLRRYSAKTIKNYRNALIQCAIYAQNNVHKTVNQLTQDDIYKYFLYLTKERKVSVSTVRISRFTLQFYTHEVLRKDIDLSFMHGLRKEKQLPKTLTHKEILCIISSITNLKHRLMISLLYSSGLRVSEVINLKVGDVNLDSLVLHIRCGKGKKDRITIFSENIKEHLTEFVRGRQADEYVFTSNCNSKKKNKLTVRTVQAVFKSALKRSGVQKNATCHHLRHSFATHLLENGTDVQYIKELLGHKSISTTSIYMHCTNPSLKKIKSPL